MFSRSEPAKCTSRSGPLIRETVAVVLHAVAFAIRITNKPGQVRVLEIKEA